MPNLPKPERELGQSMSNSKLYQASQNLPLATNQQPKWVALDRVVLSFNCYFKETVNEASGGENYRTRKCVLYYYLEDETVQIVESKQENAGMPQGNFVKRHQVMYEGKPLSIDNGIACGAAISIYGRRFQIIGCNGSTAEYLQKQGMPVEQYPYPGDPWEDSRTEFMSRETGADPDVIRNSLKNPMKKFAEATLGNTVNNSGLQGFLDYDRIVLNFEAIYDDSSSLYGDVMCYTIQFYLSNNKVEVLENPSPNSGRDPFPKLLKKQRLLKNWNTDDANGRADESDDSLYYTWKDFTVGASINVYNRILQIVNADGATRRFYEAQGAPLADALPIKGIEKRVIPEITYAEYNGWGNEDDSLGSCIALVPKAPKTPFDIMGQHLSSQKLNFSAKMVTTHPDDVDRRFIIQFFLEDNTLRVREPPQRNSGVIGGNFLERSSWANPETGKPFAESDFAAGKKISFKVGEGGTSFEILDVDEATLKYMEGKPAKFPMSDISVVCAKIGEKMLNTGSSITDWFRKYDRDKSGNITIDEFSAMIEECTGEAVDKQVKITIMRTCDKDGDGKVNYDEFRKGLERGMQVRRSSQGHSMMDFDEYDKRADAIAADERSEIVIDGLLTKFTNKFLERGSLSASLLRLANHKDFITRNDFITGLSQSKSAQDSDSMNLYFLESESQLLAGKFFGEEDSIKISDFAQKVAKYNLAAGARAHHGHD